MLGWELMAQKHFSKTDQGAAAVPADKDIGILTLGICRHEIYAAVVTGAVLLNKYLTVIKEYANIEIFQHHIATDIHTLAVLDVGLHGIAGDVDTEVRRGRCEVVTGNVNIIGTLDGCGVAGGRGREVFPDIGDRSFVDFSVLLVLRAGREVFAVLNKLLMSGSVQHVVDAVQLCVAGGKGCNCNRLPAVALS